MHKIIVKISNRHTRADREKIKEKYNMDMPTHVHVYLTDRIMEKMRKIKSFALENFVSEMRFISSSIKDADHPHIELFRDDVKIEASMYDDFDRQFPTFEEKHFMMRCEGGHKGAFVVEIGYHRGDCSDYYFDTALFDLEDAVLISE